MLSEWQFSACLGGSFTLDCVHNVQAAFAYQTLLRAKAGSRTIPLDQSHLWLRCFFGFSDAAGFLTGAMPSRDADAIASSPLARSLPTSRRGQEKSSARPGGGVSASPLNSVRAASASTAAGLVPGPPSN